jgi:hypothetical protein
MYGFEQFPLPYLDSLKLRKIHLGTVRDPHLREEPLQMGRAFLTNGAFYLRLDTIQQEKTRQKVGYSPEKGAAGTGSNSLITKGLD